MIEKILQVYGYYLTRSLSGEGGSDKPAEKVEFTAESINETVEKLNLSAAITIVADMIGIVQVKNGMKLDVAGV